MPLDLVGCSAGQQILLNHNLQLHEDGGAGASSQLAARHRHIKMADFPVSCPSESNQISYYNILRFLPPSASGSPGALLAPSVEEMFPLQPSVVMGGHIGNQSRNRRTVQRAGPPRLRTGSSLAGDKRSMEVRSGERGRWTLCHALMLDLYIVRHMGEHIGVKTRAGAKLTSVLSLPRSDKKTLWEKL